MLLFETARETIERPRFRRSRAQANCSSGRGQSVVVVVSVTSCCVIIVCFSLRVIVRKQPVEIGERQRGSRTALPALPGLRHKAAHGGVTPGRKCINGG